jgi:Spy/CpxP family protein refolding chaperone
MADRDSPEETVTEELHRLLRRTDELSNATDALSRKRFDKAENEALAAQMREHRADLRAH